MTRRSSRLRVRIPVFVKSLDPASDFSSACVALVVNAHGCAVQAAGSLPVGTPVHLKVRDGGEGTARVVECKPLGQHADSIVALELDNPGNIWALKSPPDDWLQSAPKPARPQPARPAIADLKTSVHLNAPGWPFAGPSANNGCAPAGASPEVIEQLAAQAEAIAQLRDELATSRREDSGKLEDRLAQTQQRILELAGQQLGSRLDEVGRNQEISIARLREEVAAEIRTLPDTVRRQLAELQQHSMAEAQEHFNTALAEATRPLREELARHGDRANESQQLHSDLASQVEKIPEVVEWHARALFDSWMDSARAELRQIISAAQAPAPAEAGVRQPDQEAVRALLAQASSAREGLEASLRELPHRVQQSITAAIEESLAGAREEIYGQALRQTQPARDESMLLAGELRSVADSLRAERAAATAQIDDLRSQTQKLAQWLTEQEDASTSEMAQRLDRLKGEITDRATRAFEQKLLANAAEHAETARRNLQEQLGPMLKEAGDLRDQALALLSSLRTETESFESHVRGFHNEKQQLDAWIAQRTSDFQRMFHDALVETTGQIKGRLQMAVEMMEQPLIKLRNDASQQLQDQAGMHAQEMRDQVSQFCDRLTRLQSEVEHSVREALRVQAAEATAAFTHEIAEAAQRSVEEWQSSLARNLAEISSLLGHQLSDDKT